MSHRYGWLGLLLLWMFISAAPVFAQTPAGASLFTLETGDFPRMHAYLDVYAADGAFVPGLKAEDLVVLEDGQRVGIIEFSELRPGVQVVFALNPGDSFTIRNSRGASRLDFLREALNSWANSRQGSSVDDISLLVTGGPTLTHFSDPQGLVAALQDYRLDENTPAPNLDTLLQALDIAADPSSRPGMGRSVLYITSPVQGEASQSLQELTQRAIQQGVHINVWFVASSDVLELPQASQLQEMARQTGGGFFSFSGEEEILSPETYLSKLRDIYHLVYESGLTSGGAHQLSVEIQGEGGLKTAANLDFTLDLLPPDPAFLSPVAEIVRQVPEGQESIWQQTGPDDLVPQQQALQVLIDFPDGRRREVRSTRLLVDGAVVAENTQPPFDRFLWDLSVYTSTAQHILQAEALDVLGLTGRSIETPVIVRVETPGARPLAALAQHWPSALALVALLSGALLFLALIVSGKIKPHALRVPAGYRIRKKKAVVPSIEPAAVEGEPEPRGDAAGRRLTGWVNRLHWPQRRLAQQAGVYLVRISDDELSASGSPVLITADEITLGRDKSLSMLVVDDPSVAELHSRLLREPDGTYRLVDEGSVAGTWVNYELVTAQGAVLKHGDLIHIGRVSYRFNLRDPGQPRKPTIVEEVSRK